MGVREPSEAITNILNIVRLLPPEIKLEPFFETFFETVDKDPHDWFRGLYDSYELDTVQEETSRLGRVFADSYRDLEGRDDLDSFKTDMMLVGNRYMVETLTKCLNGLPQGFVDHVALPDRSLESMSALISQATSSSVSTEEAASYICKEPYGSELFLRDGINSAGRRYDTAIEFHERIYNLLNYVEKRASEPKEGYRYYYEPPLIFAMEFVDLVDGRVRFIPDKFTEAFEGVEADRLKRCGACGRVFWVRRTDQKGCTVSCAKVLRTRKWREKTTEEQRVKYKVNRIKKTLATEKK